MLVCQNFETGEIVWENKATDTAPKKGSVYYADGKIYIVEENDGSVIMGTASAKGGWKEIFSEEKSKNKSDPLFRPCAKGAW